MTSVTSKRSRTYFTIIWMVANGLVGQSLWEKWYQSSLLMYNFTFYCFPKIQKDSLEIGPMEGLKKEHMRVYPFFSNTLYLKTNP